MPITYRDGKKTVILQDKAGGPKLAGLSDKRFLEDPTVSKDDPKSNLYIVKSVKGRSVKTVMGKDYLDRFMDESINALGIQNNSEAQQALKSYASYLFDTVVPSINSNTVHVLKTNLQKYMRSLSIPDAQVNQVIKDLDNLVDHVGSTLCDFMHTEKLGPLVAKALWGDAVVVPETFYPTDINTKDPQILTRFLKAKADEEPFKEFMRPLLNNVGLEKLSMLSEDEFVKFFKKNAALSHFTLSLNDVKLPTNADETAIKAFYQTMKTNPALCAVEVESPNFWLELKAAAPNMQLPKAADLKITPEQKKILGKLYAMALITGHYDILNNINGTNSGSMAGKPVCVDWGNSFMIGFGGLTKDENIFQAKMGEGKNQNPISLIMGSADYTTLQQQWSSQEYGIGSNEFTFPFLEHVFPYLPRLLVQDIFNLDDPDVFAGFKEFVEMANENQKNLIGAFMDAWPADNPTLAATLNNTWYHPDNFEKQESVGHIVLDRVHQLARIVPTLEAGQRQAGFQNALISDIKHSHQSAYQLHEARKHSDPNSTKPEGSGQRDTTGGSKRQRFQ